MKVGVFLVLFQDRPFEEALDFVKKTGCDAVEIGSGGYVGDAHCKPEELLADASARRAFHEAVVNRDLEISALSCHGNPLHPDKSIAGSHNSVFRDTIRLAGELGINTVVNFSGCPGDSDNAKHPNWVTCPWPPDFSSILEWQWTEKVAPYWTEVAAFAKEHGVRVAVELHPGFVAYNTESYLRLREIGGESLGVNFDPSHLFWQGMDPLVCIRELGKEIAHVHMKDTWLDQQNIRRNGVLDTRPYTEMKDRSWIFRTVGYGHGQEFWRSLMSELRLAGYDGALSIEHEDSILSSNQGFERAVSFLRDSVPTEMPGTSWWT